MPGLRQEWAVRGCAVCVKWEKGFKKQSGLKWGPWVMCWGPVGESWLTNEYSVMDSGSSPNYLPHFPVHVFSSGSLVPQGPTNIVSLCSGCNEAVTVGSVLTWLVLLHGEPGVDKDLALKALEKLTEAASTVKLVRGLPFLIESTPFAEPFFYNSWCKGIISNVIGRCGDLLLLDSKLAPGCEGAPIFHVGDNERVCFGVVVCVMLTKGNETLGFSLGVSLLSILSHFAGGLDLYSEHVNLIPNSSPPIPSDSSVVLVRCGNTWGTGCVFDAKGYILTCGHSVHFGHLRDNSITVHFYGQSFDADLVFTTSQNSLFDLAVIHVKNLTSDIRPFKLGTSIPTQGENVFSIGHCIFNEKGPLYTPTITTGIIAKEFNNYELLHTTCVVQKGSSGGAVIRENGELIGIIAFNILETSSCFSYISLSVPITSVLSILTEYVNNHDQRILMGLENYGRTIKERRLCSKL